LQIITVNSENKVHERLGEKLWAYIGCRTLVCPKVANNVSTKFFNAEIGRIYSESSVVLATIKCLDSNLPMSLPHILETIC